MDPPTLDPLNDKSNEREVAEEIYVFVRMTPLPSPTELQGWFGKCPDLSSLCT